MARGRASACLWVALWVWCASVCAADARDTDQHPEGTSDNRPASPPLISANVTSPAPSPPPPPPTVTRMQKPPENRPTDGGGAGVDSRQETEAQGSSGKEAPVREAASKRNASVLGGIGSGALSAAMRAAPSSSSSATAEQLRSATSLAGNLALLLISVVIAGALFVMVVCFIHKWKENMGTGRYPRVVYSMLRQSEDEPEDVLGEILINIGLAAPGDTCPRTPSSSSSSSRCSPAPAEPDTMDINDLEGSKFTTIPLRSDEAAKRLMAPEPEESDEELLQ